MSKKVCVSFRMEEKLKQDADKLFDKLGMDMVTGITLFIEQAVREQGIPFEVSLKVPNKDTIKALEDAQHRRNLTGSFDSVEELFISLEADDND